MTNMYFSHPAYDDYPVVGVTWKQALAFTVWRTLLLNNFCVQMTRLLFRIFVFQLNPEWNTLAVVCNYLRSLWGGPYIRNARGCF